MKTCHTPEGWSKRKYKLFKSNDCSESSSESDSDSESESESEEKPKPIRGYENQKYKKILIEEELLPE
jgi:FtsZ-interacting cell division protein ZipA